MSRVGTVLCLALLSACGRRRTHPVAPATMTPGSPLEARGAYGAGACAMYAACCQQALAAGPANASAQASCAQLSVLSSLGETGERACAQGLAQLTASFASTGRSLPSVCVSIDGPVPVP